MALESRLLNHYGITSLYPTEWPHKDNEDDDDFSPDASDEENQLVPTKSHKSRQSTTSTNNNKYRNLDRHASHRSSLSATQKTSTGAASMVQKDEPDALGSTPSVVAELKKRGIPVEEDVQLRNRFLLSSTSFSPALYLSEVHREDSVQDLVKGLEFLSKSIEEKSASLKVLVESNFERFVRAKAVIDNVYTEMRTQGQEEVPEKLKARPHSRRQSHFRNASGGFAAGKVVQEDKRKNALTKESEYGVAGIKAPLVEIAVKAEEIWGPAIGGREKEETLKAVVRNLEQHKDIFELPGTIGEGIKKTDYDSVIEGYTAAKKHAAEGRRIAQIAKENDVQLCDSDVQQIVVAARMWYSVTELIEGFKRDVWKRLKSSHGRNNKSMAQEADKDLHMDLIGVLLQLGVDENPIWEYLNSRYLYLKDRIARMFERARIEIEIQRRKLAANQNVNAKALAKYLGAPAKQSPLHTGRESHKDLDRPDIIAFWEKVHYSMTALLSTQNGLLGEVMEFQEISQSFIESKAQKTFPTAVFAAGLEHLELDPDYVQKLQDGTLELLDQIRDSVTAFFSDLPVEDLSELYSPIPPTPITPSSSNTPRNFSFDPATVPPPIRSEQSWGKYAFWPPNGNTLSGSYHLARILTLVGSALTEIANLTARLFPQRSAEPLRHLLNVVRERCIRAVCEAWNTDAERIKYLEDWKRQPDRRDVTMMPACFMAFEERVLGNVQKIAFVEGVGGRGEVVVPPSAKLLQTVRGCFVTSLYKVLSGMVENAEKGRRDEEEGDTDPDRFGMPLDAAFGQGAGESGGLDVSNRNIRLLTTLSNLSHLRAGIIPQLISQAETAMSVKLSDESGTIRDVLSQIDTRLFTAYTAPVESQLTQTITTGVLSPDWEPTSTNTPTGRPTDARPYVYDALLTLVLVHTEVSTTTSPNTPNNPSTPSTPTPSSTLLPHLLSHLLTHLSHSHLSAFKSRPHYTLLALMQATLDVEFLAQTLNNYTTDKASEVQSSIYVALDERTDNEARGKLQAELPEMRGVLKRLRLGTGGEFGCFRRERGRGRRGE
ncbi:hypothetical protein MBLNU230_g5068t1 [Neophaeotheca triangularis]